MKKSLAVTALAGYFQACQAHYVFSRLIVNNTLSSDFQFVRDTRGNSGANTLWYKSFPIFGTEDPDLICGRSSFPILNPSIETAIIIAGDDVTFMLSGPMFEGDAAPNIYHDGPGQIFLSKLPEEVKSLNDYDGTGDWFKIAYAGPKNATAWSLAESQGMNFTIPKTTPPGKYLLRVEHFLASSSLGESQWFVSCAHVNIVGAGGGQPTEFVRFPNAYKADDPSVWFHDEMTNRLPKDITVYIEPKPAVWTG